jgi:hypothetical protein
MAEDNKIGGFDLAIAALNKIEVVYDDSLKPLAKRVGKIGDTLGGVIEIALSPLEKMVFNFDQKKQELSNNLKDKLKNTPVEDIIDPPPHVVVPALQKLVYTEAEELKNMFANLIANSMDLKTSSFTHPAFVDIISQLTPDEARLIDILAVLGLDLSIPKIDIIEYISEDKKSGFEYISANITLLGEESNIVNKTQINFYLSNLERLKIVEIMSNQALFGEEFYRPLFEKVNSTLSSNNRIELKRGLIRLTPFGAMFTQNVTNRINN